jgi:hypothetical protein
MGAKRPPTWVAVASLLLLGLAGAPSDVQTLARRLLQEPDKLPQALPPGTPADRRDDLLAALEPSLDFAASERVESAWGAVPRRSADRRAASSGTLRFAADSEGEIEASVYSLPSSFFRLEEVKTFLAGVRAAAPERTLVVLTDLPLRRGLDETARRLRIDLLETYGRPYSPWPRDPFSLVRTPQGAVRVLVRPNLQRGREEDAHLGAELIQNLPEGIDRKWGRVTWSEAPMPFHNGQILLTPDAAWVSIHTLEPHILARLKLDRVPVETFGTAEGIGRYGTAARQAAGDLSTLYGRPVRFVHPLPGQPALMRTIGGGAGYDLDSLLTLLPGGKGKPASALVGDLTLGRSLLDRATADDWKALRATYGLEPDGPALAAALAAAQTDAAALDAFLDLTAAHLVDDGLRVRRLPLLTVPVELLRDRAAYSHPNFLLTWNNVVVETRGGKARAEGFASGLPAGDRLAGEVFGEAGVSLELLPPLVKSIVLNGGYRCASNHVRAP